MTPWERMAADANALLRPKLNQPLCGADLLWLSIIIARHGGSQHATVGKQTEIIAQIAAATAQARSVPDTVPNAATGT